MAVGILPDVDPMRHCAGIIRQAKILHFVQDDKRYAVILSAAKDLRVMYRHFGKRRLPRSRQVFLLPIAYAWLFLLPVPYCLLPNP